MHNLLIVTRPGCLALLAALLFAGCNPFTDGGGGLGQLCSAEKLCAGDLVCCLDRCHETCDQDNDGYSIGKTDEPDCNDTNPTVHPGAEEVCNNVDDDCDGRGDEEADPLHLYDDDEDGYHTCDCDRGDPLIHPGAQERCNTVDDDCDGEVDEGLTAQDCQYSNEHGTCTGIEVCDGGFWICDADVPEAEICDGRDNDCDELIDEDLEAVPCQLQAGVCSGTVTSCVDGTPGVCDYGDDYHPDTDIGGPDGACDGLDNDCDGQTDEDGVPVLEAEAGAQANDGLDNNCNGIFDEPGGVMVEILGLAGRRAWIDAYEATVFEQPDCSGARFGAAADDYPAEWPADAPNSIDLFACSLPGLIPSGSLSRWRAARACQAQGKRLCTNGEWKLACATELSTYPWNAVELPPGICNAPWSGSGGPVETGSMHQCTPNEETVDEETYDMIGNLAEWIADDHFVDPTMGLVGGWSYSREVCMLFGANCNEADPNNDADALTMHKLTNCIPGEEEFYGYPPTLARADFGTRCCLDEFCGMRCTVTVALACANGPADMADCLEGCRLGEIACPTESAALKRCLGSDRTYYEAIYECNASDLPEPADCIAENDALATCISQL